MRSATLVGASVVAALLAGATPAFAQDTLADLSCARRTDAAGEERRQPGASGRGPRGGGARGSSRPPRRRHAHRARAVARARIGRGRPSHLHAAGGRPGRVRHVRQSDVLGHWRSGARGREPRLHQRAASARASVGTRRAAGGAGTLLPCRLRRARRAVGRRQRRHVSGGSAVPPAADSDPHRDPAQGQHPRCRIPRRDLGPQQRPEAHGRVGPR